MAVSRGFAQVGTAIVAAFLAVLAAMPANASAAPGAQEVSPHLADVRTPHTVTAQRARTTVRGSTAAPAPRTAKPRGRAVRATCATATAPGSVTAAAGTNLAAVSWQPADGSGSTITSYVVSEVSGPNAGESIGASTSATSVVLGGLASGVPATFAVAAITACGAGAQGVSPSATPTGSATTYAASVISSAPVAYYRLGDEASGLMADSSGNGNDGVFTGQALPGSPAIPADPTTSVGSDPTVNCCGPVAAASDAALPQVNAPRTVEAWVRTTQAGDNPIVVGYGDSSILDQAFVVGLHPDAVTVDGEDDDQIIPTSRTLNDGQWHYLAVTYDGSIITVYLDGTQQGTARFNGTLDTQPATLGLAGGFDYRQYTGQVQDVAVYGQALSATTIARHFAASGYGVPVTPVYARVTTAGSNTAAVSWASATAPNATVTAYLVTVDTGPNTGESIAVAGDGTATRLTGLAPGPITVSVTAEDSYGGSVPAISNSYVVKGASSTYDSTVLGLTPSVFYRLADGSNTMMSDSSPNQVTGAYVTSNVTPGGSAALASDPSTSVSDQGSEQGIGSSQGMDPVLPLHSSARSVEVWEKTTWNENESLASWGQQGTDQAFTLGIGPSAVTVDGDGDAHGITTPYPVDDGVWHMIGATFDGSTITAYVDGLAIGTTQFNDPIDTQPSPFVMGSSPSDANPLYTTSLADAAVFPTALTAGQVAAQFAASGHARPSAPGGLSAIAGANQATVSWSTSSTAAGSTLEDYVVTALSGSGQTPGPSVSVPASATSATLTGLTAGSDYTFRVAGVDSYGQGAGAATPPVTPTGSTATYVSTVLGLNPSVFYRLADGSTTTMTDSSPNQENGAYVASNVTLGEPSALASDPAPSLSDQTKSQGIGSSQTAASVLPTGASARSVEVWEKTTENFYQALASWGQLGSGSGFTLAISGYDIAVDAYNDDHQIVTPYPIDDGVWHMIGATFDGSTITVYLDGVALGTTQFNSTPDTLPGPFLLGSDPGGANQLYGVSLADAAAFPTALTAGQMATQFAASGYARPTAPSGLSVTASTNQAAVSWSTPATAPGTTLKGYVVTALSGSGQTPGPSVSVPASATSATLTGLIAGTGYTFRVTGVDPYGEGAPADTPTAATPTGSASTYVSTVLGLNPTVFYRLADTSNAALTDSSPHQQAGFYEPNPVTLGVAGPLPGDSATAVQDDGYTIGTAYPTALPSSDAARTVETWLNTTNSDEQCMVGWGAQSGTAGFNICLTDTTVSVQGYGDGLDFTAPASLSDGNWHFVAVTATATSATVYVDGQLVGTQTSATSLDTIPDTPLRIGSQADTSLGFYGALADVAVFPAVLTAAQISAQYASGTATESTSDVPHHS